jgi:hypothetical protein
VIIIFSFPSFYLRAFEITIMPSAGQFIQSGDKWTRSISREVLKQNKTKQKYC